MVRPRAWRERFRLEYKEVVKTTRGQSTVVLAKPKIDIGGPLDALLPEVITLAWSAIRALQYQGERRPWVVQTFPLWNADKAETIAELSRWDAIERAKSEAAALRACSGR